MANFSYTRPGWNYGVGGGVTYEFGSSVSGGELPNLHDDVPAVAWRGSQPTTILRWNLGSAQRVDIFVLIAHNTTGTLNLQGFNNASYSGPLVNINIPAVYPDNDAFLPNRWVDLAGAGYAPATRTLQYWRLAFGEPGQPIAGEIWFGQKYTLEQNVEWGVVETINAPTIVHRTDMGVEFRYSYGFRNRKWEGELSNVNANTAAAIKNLFLDAHGRQFPFLIFPEGDTGEPMMVRFAEDEMPQTQEFLGQTSMPLSFEELSRGIRL